MKHFSLVIGAILAMTLCLPLHAEKVYKWQDENGSWHYSEKPPMEGDTQVIKMKSHYAGAQGEESSPDIKKTENSDQNDGASLSGKQGAVTTKSAPKPAYTDEQKKTNCDLARSRLEGLDTHPRVLINDDKTGEQRYLSPEEHAEWMERSKKEIQEFCD